VAAALVLVVPLAGAQTIGDYSRAQRAFLESAMAQAAARAAGASAPAPAVAASASAAPTASLPRTSPRPAPPAVQVSGVFAAGAGAIAEVRVDGTPYLLWPGEGVPGTAWQVQAVAVDRVVLARRGDATDADAAGGVRVFSLPALR